jgi:hypothetical protein
LKTELARQFEMKDLSYLWYFLGTKIAYSPRGYLLSQSKYVIDILERARLTNNKTVNTPIKVNTRYSSFNGLSLTDPTLYRIIVRSLVYLTITRSYIAYVVHVISQFVNSPITIYLAVVLCILWYLRVQFFRVFYFHPPFSWSYMHNLMLIMIEIPQIASLLLVSVSF